MLICVVLIIGALISALNLTVDPFGVFGGGIFEWNSYSMTLNPKTAKFAYVDARVGEFDAFIVGPSGASGFSPEILEYHTGLRWFNMFNYGADMEYTAGLAEYLIEIHQPQMLLLVVPIISASQYAMEITDITYNQPLRPFWRVPFLFANPQFSTDKISNRNTISYLQQPFDVFNALTGTYNKTRRDAEAIGDFYEYLQAYPSFVDMYFPHIPLNYIEENAAAVERILNLAKQNGTEVIVVTTPMVHAEMGAFKHDEISEFYEMMAIATGGFWDFTFSTISGDVRYFYDTTHFRNSVGEMMLAQIFGVQNIWIPDDLGHFITVENAGEVAQMFVNFYPRPRELNERRIPILLYHDLTNEDGFVSPEMFREHIQALYSAGFSAVSLTDLKDYVFRGVELPPNPVVITFDDGYLSNYIYAFPILQDFNFHATIFPMGVSFGRDTHWYSGNPIRPRFGEAESRRMIESGIISLQSHTFDMHHATTFDVEIGEFVHLPGFDPEPFRRGILRRDNESEADYIEFLRNDHAQIRALLEPITEQEVFAIAYPYGWSDELSAVVLRNAGVTMTFSTTHNFATLVRGLPQSLLKLNRFSIYAMTSDELIQMISHD